MTTHSIPYRHGPSGQLNAGFVGLLLAGGIGVVLTIGIATLDSELATRLTSEDGLVENLTMLFFAAGCAACLNAVRRTPGIARYHCILWAGLCFVFFGEEVSWGQRWFAYETPEILASNYQGEANLHNLPLLTPRVIESPLDLVTSQGLFYAGFFFYFFALPLGTWCWAPASRLARRLALPEIPKTLFVAIWVPVFFSFAIAGILPFGPSREALTETRELLFALSILLYTIVIARSSWARSPQAAKLPERTR